MEYAQKLKTSESHGILCSAVALRLLPLSPKYRWLDVALPELSPWLSASCPRPLVSLALKQNEPVPRHRTMVMSNTDSVVRRLLVFLVPRLRCSHEQVCRTLYIDFKNICNELSDLGPGPLTSAWLDLFIKNCTPPYCQCYL